MLKLNAKQQQTFEMLISAYEIDPDDGIAEEPDGAIVFEGYGVDGPCCGWIEIDGVVNWIVGG